MSLMSVERPRTRLHELVRERSDEAAERRRTGVLHDMLNHYNEARSEATGAGGGGSRHESRINAWDPETWTPAYRELERCLEGLRWLAQHGRPMIERGVSSGAAWWHLRARYLEAELVRREVHLRKTHSGTRVPVPLPRNEEVVARPTILQGRSQTLLVRRWDQRVDPHVVQAALRWISREFKGQPAPYSVA